MSRALLAALLLAGCGSDAAAGAHGPLRIVAAENTWGSIAAQLGGPDVRVTSVVTDPNVDPHDYQSSARVARALATADEVIVNGAGYDDWAQRLLDAEHPSHRLVTSVAELLGAPSAANPHFWYSPDAVARVADRITADLVRLDPRHRAAYLDRRARLSAAFSPLRSRIEALRRAGAHHPVAATESIVLPLTDAAGLSVVSPRGLMTAVSEGNDPSVDDIRTFEAQLTGHAVSVVLYNRQTVTAVTERLRADAAAAGIPVVGVTETVQPAEITFQDWQTTQIDTLLDALGAASR